MKRLFILSIDGVPYSLLTSLIDMGVMPFFKSLITEKGFRRYNSVLPTISSVAWASFMTGKILVHTGFLVLLTEGLLLSNSIYQQEKISGQKPFLKLCQMQGKEPSLSMFP